MTHPALLPVEELLQRCELSTGRRRGPGGQHRNKTDSAVILRHTPTGVEGRAAERRSQADNHRAAVRRLRVNLALEVRDPCLGETAPTELWQSRTRQQRIAVNPEHADFPALLAEALDVIAARNGHFRTSAEQLGVTPSQLLKFLKEEPRAWRLVNAWRKRFGLGELA